MSSVGSRVTWMGLASRLPGYAGTMSKVLELISCLPSTATSLVSIPSADHLSDLLNAASWASLQQEEGRPVAVPLLLQSPSTASPRDRGRLVSVGTRSGLRRDLPWQSDLTRGAGMYSTRNDLPEATRAKVTYPWLNQVASAWHFLLMNRCRASTPSTPSDNDASGAVGTKRHAGKIALDRIGYVY